jgi:hypothetical protein
MQSSRRCLRHAKVDVTRTFVEHCSGKIRSILEHIEAIKQASSRAAAPPLAAITAYDVAEAIGRIGLIYARFQQAFIDNSIDGAVLASLFDQSDEDTLRTLTTDLGITSIASLLNSAVQFIGFTSRTLPLLLLALLLDDHLDDEQ